MAGPKGRIPGIQARETAAAGPGERYRAQLGQLDKLIGTNDRSRAIADWAVNYFPTKPEIEALAKAVSKKVDEALLAVNPLVKPIEWLQSMPAPLDLTSAFDWWRTPLDSATKLYTDNSPTPWMITYRIPRATAVGIWAVQDLRGKCEEHAFLALYLLTLGHMIQNTEFGRLRNEIYYAGLGLKGHGCVVAVKGAEMKEVIKEAPDFEDDAVLQWLAKNPKKWGNSAWIIDGFEEPRLMAKESRPVVPELCESFRRDPSVKDRSPWDLTLVEMARRIVVDYKLGQ